MIDRRQDFPNQGTEERHNECVGETVADILGNIFNQEFHPGFNYGAAHHLDNKTPFFKGSYPFTGMQTAVLYGGLPSDDDLAENGEDYEADFSHYPDADKQLARAFAMNGVKTLKSYDEVCAYLDRQQMGVAIGMNWFQSFGSPLSDGSLPSPVGTSTNHCVAVYGHDERGLQIKPWLGPEYGQAGYCYLSRTLWPTIVREAYGFDPYASRWWSIATIGLTHWGAAGEALAELKRIKV